MKKQQQKIDELNKQSKLGPGGRPSESASMPGNSGDSGLVEQVATIVLFRI
jgi:hypothetical protein